MVNSFARSIDGVITSGFSFSQTVNNSVYQPEHNKSSMGKNMSLVIMMRSKYGIVACADSKGTICDSLGQCYEERERIVQKIFKTKNMVILTYGNNRIKSNKYLCYLESVMNKMLYPEISFDILLKRLKDISKVHLNKYPNDEYFFEVGHKTDKSDDKYQMHSILINKNGIKNTLIDTNIILGGSIDLIPRNFNSNYNWSIDEMKDACKLLMECNIKLGDKFLAYNPVGGEIQIEALV